MKLIGLPQSSTHLIIDLARIICQTLHLEKSQQEAFVLHSVATKAS